MLQDITYTDLYSRWEQGSWQAAALDFTKDKEDWHTKLTPLQRDAALWNYSMFFHGEDAVATDLAPFVYAAPSEETRYFLATQQADEARHSVFFSRFFADVIAYDPRTAVALQQSSSQLSWGFIRVFELLREATERLHREPTKANLAAAVSMYHIIVEATLAQPGQHLIQSYVESSGLLPAFAEGMTNVARDEQRHIAFGVKLLSELVQDPKARQASARALQHALSYVASVFVPPQPDFLTCFGITQAQVYADGFRSLEKKLHAVGFTPAERERITGFPADMAVEDRIQTVLALLDGNFIGHRLDAPSDDRDLLEAWFAVFARVLGPQTQPLTVQWMFGGPHDHSAWVALDERTRSGVGWNDQAQVLIRTSLPVWLDLTQNRTSVWQALRTGALRVSGRPRDVLRLGQLLREHAA
jgi:hypothetical protein